MWLSEWKQMSSVIHRAKVQFSKLAPSLVTVHPLWEERSLKNRSLNVRKFQSPGCTGKEICIFLEMVYLLVRGHLISSQSSSQTHWRIQINIHLRVLCLSFAQGRHRKKTLGSDKNRGKCNVSLILHLTWNKEPTKICLAPRMQLCTCNSGDNGAQLVSGWHRFEYCEKKKNVGTV